MRFEPAKVADRGRSRGAGVTDLVVLTDSEEFQSALKQAVGTQQRVWRVPTTDQAAELLVAGRVGVLVIDTECVPHDAPTLITQLNLEFPDLVVVVAGTHDEVSQFAHLVGEGLVYRFLQKPVSPARVRAFIDAAIRRHSELMAEAPAAVVARKKRRRSQPRRIVFVLIALALIGAIYAKWHRPEPQRSHAAAAKPAALAVPSQQLPSTVEKRSPPQTAAAPAAPRQAEAARDEAAIDRALAAQSARRPQATTTPASKTAPAIASNASAPKAIRSPEPTQPAVSPVPSRPFAPSSAADEAPVTAGNASPDGDGQKRTDRLTGLARLAAQRVAEDRLTEPAGDNAREYLRQLNAEDPLLAAPLWQQLAQHLLNKARREQEQGNFDSAEHWLKEADDTGVIGSEIAAARADLRDARVRTSFLSNVVPVSQLKSTKYVPAVYPPKALDRGVEGWVELEFTVDASGRVRDIAVKRAVPTGVFEKAAADALSKWRFQPVLRSGAAVDQRASVRMQFKLER
jgi:protein TonB